MLQRLQVADVPFDLLDSVRVCNAQVEEHGNPSALKMLHVHDTSAFRSIPLRGVDMIRDILLDGKYTSI
jgi:hypothetical protein